MKQTDQKKNISLQSDSFEVWELYVYIINFFALGKLRLHWAYESFSVRLWFLTYTIARQQAGHVEKATSWSYYRTETKPRLLTMAKTILTGKNMHWTAVWQVGARFLQQSTFKYCLSFKCDWLTTNHSYSYPGFTPLISLHLLYQRINYFWVNNQLSKTWSLQWNVQCNKKNEAGLSGLVANHHTMLKSGN